MTKIISKKTHTVLEKMATAKKGTPFLKEFKDFIAFLQSLWGILAGISVFFPLSNVLLGVIPLVSIYDDPGGALTYFSPELVTAVTTLVTLFIVFWTFGNRSNFSAKKRKHSIRRGAFISFVVGFLALMIYLTLNFTIYDLLYWPFEMANGESPRWLGDILVLIAYSSFFALVTRAFMLLGMIEYFGPKKIASE
jgi:lysylphosphatidylglycerol synthetase-like protein (DUF2156 family)